MNVTERNANTIHRSSFNCISIPTSGVSRPGVWGGSQIGVHQKGLRLFKLAEVVCDNRWESHKSGYLFQSKKVAILFGRTNF